MCPVSPIKATAIGVKIYVQETSSRTLRAEILGQIKAGAREPSHWPVSVAFSLGSSACGLSPPGFAGRPFLGAFLLGLAGLRGPGCGEGRL